MISEKLILKNLGYVSLLTLLAAIYIGNRFHAEKLTGRHPDFNGK